MDEEEISAGDHIRRQISKGLTQSDVFLLVISSNSIKSEWVKFEIAQAMGKENIQNIIPILLNANPSDLPEPYREISDLLYLNFMNKENWEINIKKLISAINKKLVREN